MSWHRIEDADLPADGRVRSVIVDGRSVAVSRCAGRLGALENRCPHQNGPLGEGSIEQGWLRCPWHCYDYRPDTATGLSARSLDEVDTAVSTLLATPGPALLHIEQDGELV
jgi:nitrite reductase/ring-hydroxylating ferredoxin subunit